MLRVRIEPSAFEEAEPEYRITIEHVGSGRKVSVTSYDEVPTVLAEFMRRAG